MDKIRLLQKLFLFNDLNFDAIDREYSVAKNLAELSYCSGDVILSTHEDPMGIGIITSGKAMISTAVRGNAPTLRSLAVGDTFGAASLFMKERGYTTGVISDGASSVIYITEENVRMLCKKVPEIAMNYIEFLADRIAFLNKKVSTFSPQSADARIAYYIYGLTNGEKLTARMPVSYSALSEMLGIGRASLYRALDSLSEQNIISRDARNITVLQPDKLRKNFN